MPEPLCEWATCDGVEAEPGSLYCKPHGRQARLEGAPWRRPGAELPAGAGSALAPVEPEEPDDPEAGTRPPAGTTPPRMPPALQPAQATCRREGCTNPPLAKTIESRSNRWRNLCEQHYAEARANALGGPRRAQLEQIAGPLPRPEAERGNGAEPARDPAPLLLDARSYTDRAAELVELAAELDDAREQLDRALTRWRLAVAELTA